LLEQPRLINWKHNYLDKIELARNENRKIFYLDETWYNTGDSKTKSWSDGSNFCLKKCPSINRGERLMIIHCGNEDGFINDGLFVIRTREAGNLDYHKDMDSYNFEKYAEQQLFPLIQKISPNSVLVMDNAPYHSRKVNKLPKMHWLKSEIVDWFLQHSEITLEKPAAKYTKKQLIEFAINSGIKEEYAVEKLAQRFGIQIIRLPPYHCHLNPIELIWNTMKQYINRFNTTYNPEKVKQLVKDACFRITPQIWSNSVEKIKKLEKESRNNIVFSNINVNLQDSDEDIEDSGDEYNKEIDLSSDLSTEAINEINLIRDRIYTSNDY
jgi:transposase